MGEILSVFSTAKSPCMNACTKLTAKTLIGFAVAVRQYRQPDQQHHRRDSAEKSSKRCKLTNHY
jgi:hypothetical protein